MREGTRDSEYNSYICLDIVMAFYKKKKKERKAITLNICIYIKKHPNFRGKKVVLELRKHNIVSLSESDSKII